MPTKMHEEIWEQPKVLENLWNIYSGQAIGFHQKIKGVRQLFLIGTGASYYACAAVRQAFIQYSEVLPLILHASEALTLPSRFFNESLVILVSQSGQSVETQELASYLRKENVDFWAVTNHEDSFLAKSAGVVLPLFAGDEVSSATKTYSAAVYVLYLMACAADQPAMAEIRSMKDHMAYSLEAAGKKMKAWVSGLRAAKTGYIAGFNCLDSVAWQGALLLKEKCFIHVEGMSIHEFRHGTVETVYPAMPVLLSYDQEDTAVAEKHISYLADIYADIYIVTNDAADVRGISEDRIVRVKYGGRQALAHISQITPYQLLAEGVAVANGYDVDGFIHLSKVVDHY